MAKGFLIHFFSLFLYFCWKSRRQLKGKALGRSCMLTHARCWKEEEEEEKKYLPDFGIHQAHFFALPDLMHYLNMRGEEEEEEEKA